MTFALLAWRITYLRDKMAEKCGDDILAARRFMNLCSAHMSEIFSGGQLPLFDVIDKLGEIQSQAKLMRARSIYRCTQDVIDDLTRRRSVQGCAGSVLVLQKLIRQYETGLSEIAPVARQVLPAARKNPAGPLVVSELSAQKQASEILGPLVKFADDTDRTNLVSLIDLAANEARPMARVPEKPSAQNIDVILPALTNHWLRLARTQGKSISVSSSLDEAQMKDVPLKQLQTGLKHLGELLISQTVETPDVRESRSMSRSAHLALTARKSSGGLDVLLSCEGPSPRESDFDLISKTLSSNTAIKTFLSTEDNLIRVELTNLPLANQQATPPRPKEVLV